MRVKNGILLISMLMVACEKEDMYGEEETYKVENVEFEKDTNVFEIALSVLDTTYNDKVNVDTDGGTYVININYVTIYKTENEESTISIKKRVKSGDEYIGRDGIVGDIYLNKEDIKEVSKQYANLYKTTFEDN